MCEVRFLNSEKSFYLLEYEMESLHERLLKAEKYAFPNYVAQLIAESADRIMQLEKELSYYKNNEIPRNQWEDYAKYMD